MFAGVRNKSLTCEKLLIIVYWFECCYCVTIILVRKNDDGYNNCYVICITSNTRHSQSQLCKCTLPINCFKLRFQDFKDIKLVECALSMTSVCSANIMNFKEMVFYASSMFNINDALNKSHLIEALLIITFLMTFIKNYALKPAKNNIAHNIVRL